MTISINAKEKKSGGGVYVLCPKVHSVGEKIYI